MKLILGDCLEKLKELESESVDAVVSDPPAGISFMGKDWDKDKGGRDNWIAWMQEIMTECNRVLKPGGHAVIWALPRTSHWTARAIEDAGFEIRDVINHIFASGFPKSANIGKMYDKLQGNEREVVGDNPNHRTLKETNCMVGEPHSGDGKLTKGNSKWEGFGTNLKPAYEHWILARKKLAKVYLYELFEIYGFNYYITTSTATEGTKRYQSYIDKGFEPVTENADEIRERITAQVEKKYEDDEDGLIDYEQEIEDKILKATPKKVFRFETKLATNPSVESIWTIETVKGKETIKTEKYKKIWKNNNVVNCLKWGTGAIQIDGCRIPIQEENVPRLNKEYIRKGDNNFGGGKDKRQGTITGDSSSGRFPANIICTDDALNDGVMTKSSGDPNRFAKTDGGWSVAKFNTPPVAISGDSGSKSRYFDIDVWAEKHGLLQFPKASKRERNEGCEGLEFKIRNDGRDESLASGDMPQNRSNNPKQNHHPTVKPVHLMSWLVRLVSKEGDTVLDPFMGSGTTGVACKKLGRNFIGIEMSEEYISIATARINNCKVLPTLFDKI